jgi:hypothetical protein
VVQIYMMVRLFHLIGSIESGILDDQDDDDVYLIAYDAVCEYSNKEHSTFNQY